MCFTGPNTLLNFFYGWLHALFSICGSVLKLTSKSERGRWWPQICVIYPRAPEHERFCSSFLHYKLVLTGVILFLLVLWFMQYCAVPLHSFLGSFPLSQCRGMVELGRDLRRSQMQLPVQNSSELTPAHSVLIVCLWLDINIYVCI